jgi:hypothetical protein
MIRNKVTEVSFGFQMLNKGDISYRAVIVARSETNGWPLEKAPEAGNISESLQRLETYLCERDGQ